MNLTVCSCLHKRTNVQLTISNSSFEVCLKVDLHTCIFCKVAANLVQAAMSFIKMFCITRFILKTRLIMIMYPCVPPLPEMLYVSSCLFKAPPPEYLVSSDWAVHTCLNQQLRAATEQLG